ncbi:MAG: hypothetical protein KatS3mg110_2508 [Pirellulaceae bacterium]|nr:MAG: hypothetical protein KatS3mg110_2508 [Pirellulaceae bacterium]
MRGPAWLSPGTPHSGTWPTAVRRISQLAAAWLSAFTAAVFCQEAPPLRERIDQLVESAYVGQPARMVTDAEFLRRVSLDLTGRIPTAEEARAFLADTSPDKRQQLVDRLLASPAFVRHMTDTFDVMWMERRPDKYVSSSDWRNYLFESFAANKPLNVLIREILSSDGTDPALRPAAKFFLDREADANLLTRDVGRMFFGVDLQCAQCHDHPLIESYLQADYYGIFAFLNRTVLFVDPKDNKKAYLGEKAEGDAKYKSAFTQEEGSTLPRLPFGEAIDDPILAKEAVYIVKPEKNVRPVARYSRRLRLAEEATSGNNLAFNRNLANRLWAMVFGRGLVEPVDLHHRDNPPVHAQLLDLLAEDLVAHQFDLRYFLRELVLSRTYQRSSEPPQQWVEYSRQAEAVLVSLEQETQSLQQAHESIVAELEKLRKERSSLLEAIEPLRQKWREAEQAWADADWAVQQAQQAVQSAQQALASQQQTHATLAEALASLQKAVALLPEAELKAAVEKLQASQKAAEEQLQKLEKELAEKQQTLQTATEKRAALQPAREQALAELQKAQGPLGELETQLRAVQRSEIQAGDRLLTAKRRLKDAQWLASQRGGLEAYAAGQDRCRQLENQLARLDQERARLQQQLTATAASPNATSAADAAPEELQKQLEKLDAETKQYSEQLAEARQAAQQQRQALDELLAQLDERWVNQLALAPLKPLSPEQLAWSTLQATGVLANTLPGVEDEVKKKSPELAEQPEKLRVAVERALEAKFAGVIREFVSLFGSGAGQPPQLFFATVDQALYLSNSGNVTSWINPSGNNLAARLVSIENPEQIAEELYLSVLTRFPDPQERQWVVATLSQAGEQKKQVIRDMIWALLSSAEFRFCP